LLKVTYLGKTSFALQSDETSVLLNPGIWNGEQVVPDDFDVRVIVATNDNDDAIGNATAIAGKAKAWFLGNKLTVEKVKEQGAKPWLLHVLENETTYKIPGLKITPFSLKREDPKSGKKTENFGLHIEIGKMKVSYIGDSMVRGPFGALEANIVIAPIGGDGVFPVKDAVSLCIDVGPQIGIPMRWTDDDQPEKFCKYIDQFARKTIPLVMKDGQVLAVHWAAGNEFKHELS
jgi:L-ascorbate metabolism protein UlaG (beta-lactamase superfamily)